MMRSSVTGMSGMPPILSQNQALFLGFGPRLLGLSAACFLCSSMRRLTSECGTLRTFFMAV